tara:strand:+ start:4824 stop:5054 length:231 start_codon:yes stop_codon:yes gene_type:complete
MSKKKKNPQISELVTFEGASELIGKPSRGIRTAADRGELTIYTSKCGRAKLLLASDVEAWSKAERKSGPKPKAKDE